MNFREPTRILSNKEKKKDDKIYIFLNLQTMDPTSRLKSIYNILRGIQEDATMEDEFPPVFYSITPEVMKELSELAFMKEKGSTTSEDLTNLLLHDVTKTLERTTVDGKKKANLIIMIKS